MNNQITSIDLFGTHYELPVIKDAQFEELQLAIKEHRDILSIDEKKRGILGFFAKREDLSAEERLRRMEGLVENYDNLIQLLRTKIQACHQVFESIGDGVEQEFLKKLETLEKLEQDRQRLAANFIKAGHTESAATFEEQAQNIRNMVTNLSRSAILIIKKLRHALDALETLASDDEKQRQVYEDLKNDVGLYRQFYEFNQKMAAVQKEIAQLTNIALNFDTILRDNLGPLGILVDQISQIDSRLSESLVEIEKLSMELEEGNTSTEALSLVSDRLISSIISGRMRKDVISDILENLRNPLSDTEHIDFSLHMAESSSSTLDFSALADNMRTLVRQGIHDLEFVAAPSLKTPEASLAPAEPAMKPSTDSDEPPTPSGALEPSTSVSPPEPEPRTLTTEGPEPPPESPESPSGPPREIPISAKSSWVPPPPRSTTRSPWGDDRAPYSAPISRATPSLVVFLLDQSGSMGTHFTQGLSRAEYLAQVVDQAIEELCTRCNKADGIRDYFDLAVLGYGDTKVQSLLPNSEGVPWLPISTVARSPRRVWHDAQGIPHPEWVPVVNGGDTPMRAALERTCHLVAQWCDEHPASYPPTVINITDGESTDGDVEPAASVLRQLHTQDGEVLLFNLHVGGEESNVSPVVFPNSPAGLVEYGSLLYRLSSPIPPHLREAGMAEGFSIGEGARFFAYGATADLATRFLNLGTRPGKLR